MKKIWGTFFKKNKSKDANEETQCNDDKFPNITGPFNILFVADTHGVLLQEDVEPLLCSDKNEIDAIIALGDVFDNEFTILKSTFPLSNIYGVLGNHNNFDDLERNNVQSLELEIVNINGLTIGGFGGSIKYKDVNMPLLTDEESTERARMLSYVDIFVTHDGPKNKKRDFAHSGLQGISEYIKENSPSYHFFGHKHEPEVILHQNGTVSICEYKLSLYSFDKSGCQKIWSSFTKK